MELLYLPECPNRGEAAELVRSVLLAEGLCAELQEVAIRDHEEVTAYAFPGSPTIRINGQDIENVPSDILGVGFACRTYLVEGKAQGIPPRTWLEQAIRLARMEEGY